MTVNVPGSWLVSSYACDYDLDNIILDSLPEVESILHAQFQLDHILIEGQRLSAKFKFQKFRAFFVILRSFVVFIFPILEYFC